MKNDGKEAQKAVLDIMQARKGVVVERFYDQSDLRGLNKGRAVVDYPKPSDFLVTEEGNIFFAEVKSVQSTTSFPFGNIEHGQKSAARRQVLVGGDYRFYLFTYGLGKWFVMPATVYANHLAAGKASVKFKDLEEWL
jgi:penicillin-binding protein-related factor A (putative recombinase)